MQLSFGIEELLAFIGTGKYDFDAFPDLCQSAKLAQILSWVVVTASRHSEFSFMIRLFWTRKNKNKISYVGFEIEKEDANQRIS